MTEAHPSDPKRVETKRRIDKICDQVESQWRAGLQPDIGALAGELDAFAVPGFLYEIITLDMEVNRRSESELRDFYSRELPEYSKIIGSILSSLFRDKTRSSILPSTREMEDFTIEPDDSFIGQKIGEYFIEEKIGEGGFGVVYLARDAYLPRRVVIKIPKSSRFRDTDDLDRFLDEARNAALLDHPHILKILHVGLDAGLPYIVQEYFEGGDLGSALRRNSFSIEATVQFVGKLASAMGYAHQHRIIHRDLKPANILLKRNGDPVIADFGMALHETQMRGRSGELAGTIRYMSPEQVRGEAHRLDGRTDIWSIGVILYLMLVGEHPFDGESTKEVREAILFGRPRPARQLNEEVTPELDRICLKCLSVRVNDRYSTGFDLAEDLKLETADGNDHGQPVADAGRTDSDQKKNIVELTVQPKSKGLVAFDKNDRDFFLELLPGPSDREGIPECVYFWKNQIEDPAMSHPVGLIYGPSGCGKSSLVAAGLLPRLAKNILVVHVESTANDTEVRLLKGLREQIPSLPQDQSLPELIAGIRGGRWMPRDRRLLIVFDQFEQWLHAHPPDEHVQLIHALRHCDGKSVQSLILVRDDFWMAISRFFRELEIELVERKNFASVDLFNKRHAKDVLIKFGQSFGSLPKPGAGEISPDQREFLDQAIDLLAEDDSVICVRLVLFAETVKNQPWSPETLRRIGDAKNIGIVFLERVLGESAKNPKYRYHRKSLLAVLEALLPDPGIEIKGNLCSKAQLAEAAGLDAESSDFAQVLNILDSELRMITPTEPDSGAGIELDEQNPELFYQLTHDYLVPSLRGWMHAERGRTRAGRAKLSLQELTSAWRSTGHKRFLPGFLEYGSIAWNVRRQKMSAVERQFMRRAHRYYGLGAFALLLVAMAIFGVWWKVAAKSRYAITKARVEQFMTGSAGSVPGIVELLRLDRRNALFLLREFDRDPTLSQDDQLRVHVGLVLLDNLDEARIKFLVDSVSYCSDAECSNLVAALSIDPTKSLNRIDNEIAMDGGIAADDRYWSRLQILKMFLASSDEQFPHDALEFRPNPTRRSTLIHYFKDWHGDLNHMLMTLNSPSSPEATIAGLCVSLGRMEPREFNKGAFGPIQKQVENLYVLDPSASVHGASQWALTNWGIKLPPIDKQRLVPTKGYGWWVNKQQMTMIRVGPGKVPFEIRDIGFASSPEMFGYLARLLATRQTALEVKHEFFISACEVTVGLFDQFLNDPGYPEEDKPKYPKNQKPEGWTINPKIDFSGQRAVSQVSKYDAILFCNWLSRIHGLEVCYRKRDKKLLVPADYSMTGIIREIDDWDLVPNVDGYRLPTHGEWEIAARGGDHQCTTDYFFADRPFVGCSEYVWSEINSMDRNSSVIHPAALKIPNQLGLFDVLGNVNEICWGHSWVIPLRPEPNLVVSSRGGSFDNSVRNCQFNWPPWSLRDPELHRHNERGFRVARNPKPISGE